MTRKQRILTATAVFAIALTTAVIAHDRARDASPGEPASSTPAQSSDHAVAQPLALAPGAPR